MKRELGSLTLALVLCAAALPSPARGAAPDPPWWAGELTVFAGFDVSRGDYGDPVDTTIFYAPITLAYLPDQLPITPNPWDQFELAVTVPFLRIDGPGDFFVPERGFPQFATTTEQGLGDVLLRGSYLWFPERESLLPVTELSARWKIPTADADRGLGTGASDFILQVDLSRSIGRVTPSVTAGYRFIGEPPEGTLDDAWFTSIGAGVRVSPRLTAGLYYDWFQAASPFRDDAHELLAYASVNLSPRVALRPYAVAGLAGDAPAWAFGLALRWNLTVGR